MFDPPTAAAARHRHLTQLWESAVIAAIANHSCRFRHEGCTGRSTRAVYVLPPAEGGAPYDRHNGRGACASCYARERAQRDMDRRRAAAAPPEPRPRSVAGLMRSYGLR